MNTLTPDYQTCERAIHRIEQQAPTDNLRALIDSFYEEMKRLHIIGRLVDRDFRVLQHRLWMKREEVCEVLLNQGYIKQTIAAD